MSSPSDIIYLKQQQAERRQINPDPEKRDYTLEEVNQWSREEMQAAMAKSGLKETNFSCKFLLGNADFSESELRALALSSDEGAQEYFHKLVDTTKMIQGKIQLNKAYLRLDCQREMIKMLACYMQN